jgi:hypothetical protein
MNAGDLTYQQITTGAALLAAVAAREIPLKRAYEINIALPLREKVWPPDLDAAASKDRSSIEPINLSARGEVT